MSNQWIESTAHLYAAIDTPRGIAVDWTEGEPDDERFVIIDTLPTDPWHDEAMRAAISHQRRDATPGGAAGGIFAGPSST